MEIDCPPHAVAIWTEGDFLAVRFPDRQLVKLPLALGPLLSVLRARETSSRRTVGTPAAPVQYDIDKIADAMNGKSVQQWEREIRESGAERREREATRKQRERERLLRKAEKRRLAKEADELLALVGL